MRMTQSAARGRSFRASSRARLLATAVFLGAATASAPFLTPAFAQVFSFSNVDIQGNDRVDAATILNYAGISRGDEVSAAYDPQGEFTLPCQFRPASRSRRK